MAARRRRDPYLTAFGQRLATIRKERRLTQEDLAEKSNLGAQYVSDMERGAANPTLLVLRDVSRALQITTARLTAAGDETAFEIDALLKDQTPADRLKILKVVRAML